MIRCAICTVDSSDGVLSCSVCGLVLEKQGLVTTTQSELAPAVATEPLEHKTHHGQLPERGIAIYVGDSNDPIIVSVQDKITLGRRKDLPIADLVDLTPFNAYKMGVSRTHAVLTYKDHRLYVHDVG